MTKAGTQLTTPPWNPVRLSRDLRPVLIEPHHNPARAHRAGALHAQRHTVWHGRYLLRMVGRAAVIRARLI